MSAKLTDIDDRDFGKYVNTLSEHDIKDRMVFP
jgi:hypothetical protein